MQDSQVGETSSGDWVSWGQPWPSLALAFPLFPLSPVESHTLVSLFCLSLERLSTLPQSHVDKLCSGDEKRREGGGESYSRRACGGGLEDSDGGSEAAPKKGSKRVHHGLEFRVRKDILWDLRVWPDSAQLCATSAQPARGVSSLSWNHRPQREVPI